MRNMICSVFLFLSYSACNAQSKIKFETTTKIGSFSYLVGLMMVDPGPNWKGYYLPREHRTGLLVTSSNGVSISELFHAGIGVGYGNFDKIGGIIAFADLRADFSRKPFSLFAYLNPGYSHFWNQYQGGRGTGMLDFGIGARYKVLNKSKILLSFGILSMQQNAYISAKLGYAL